MLKRKAIAVAGVVCASAVAGSFAGCSNNDSANSVVSMDINPGIELVVNDKDVVVSVYGTNQDGQVLLYGETDNLIGSSFADAVDKITQAAVELGYLSEENKVVQYSVSSAAGGEVANRLNGILDARVSATAEALGLTFSVEAEASVPWSVIRRYEGYLEEHPEAADLSIAQFKLALSASETGEITLDAAVKLSEQELIDIIAKAGEQATEYATKAYDAAKASAFYAFDKIADAAVNNVYATYYTTHIMDHMQTAYLGVQYSVYATGASNLETLADVIVSAKAAADKVLSSEQTAAVAAALGLTDEQLNELKDEEGNITVDSVDAYANKLFKNSEASAALETVKSELARALNTAESAIDAALEEINEEYAEEIASIQSSLESALGMLNAVSVTLPENVKSELEDLKALVARIGELTKDGVTVEDVREIAAELQAKADKTLQAIERDLTADEWKEVNDLKEKAEGTFASARKTMEDALADAEAQARAFLQELKDARKSVS